MIILLYQWIFLTKVFSSIAIATMIIDKTGKISKIAIEKSISKEFDKNMLKSINLINGDWIPAKFNGNQVDSKIYIMFQVSNSFYSQNYPYKPYVIPVLLSYYSVQRKVPVGSNQYNR